MRRAVIIAQTNWPTDTVEPLHAVLVISVTLRGWPDEIEEFAEIVPGAQLAFLIATRLAKSRGLPLL